MKKVLLFLAFTLFCLAWETKAQTQAQATLTVYDGGVETSNGIPMYGFYFDNYTKSECIIPATELSAMQWGSITSITFYVKEIVTTNNAWTNTHQKVFVKEVNSTTLGGSYSGMDGATVVFEGVLTMPTTSPDGYTITFSQPYPYSGGNLLIGVYNDEIGSKNSVTWYGTTGLTSGVSAYGFNGTSLANVGHNAHTFLPKTTFSYIPGEAPTCFKPQNLQATLTPDNGTVATLTWERNTYGTENAWVLEYGTESDFSNAISVTVTGGTSSKNYLLLHPHQRP